MKRIAHDEPLSHSAAEGASRHHEPEPLADSGEAVSREPLAPGGQNHGARGDHDDLFKRSLNKYLAITDYLAR